MKTTIEIPDPLFRKVKSKAAERDQTLKEFFTEALQDKLAASTSGHRSEEPDWMQGFGKLRRLRKETGRRCALFLFGQAVQQIVSLDRPEQAP